MYIIAPFVQNVNPYFRLWLFSHTPGTTGKIKRIGAKYVMFNESKYTRWYHNIIESAKTRPIVGYTEGHHIVPKCLGGDNSKMNIVRLTAREHFICHQLLVKMVSIEHRSRMALAATKMWQRGKNQQRDYRYHSRTYEALKKEASAFLSELNRKRWADPDMRARIIASKKGPNPNNSRKGNPNFEAYLDRRYPNRKKV